MSDELGSALAGGAIGAVLTALLLTLGRARAAWGEMGVHDEEAAEWNRQLVVWADDRTRVLLLEMERIANENAARGLFNSGINGAQLARAKADALHEYRDQEWKVKLDLAQLRAKEGGWHSFWRRVRKKPAPRIELATYDAVEPFLERWREPVTRHVGEGEPGVVPLDRTRRTTAEAHAELPDLKLT